VCAGTQDQSHQSKIKIRLQVTDRNEATKTTHRHPTKFTKVTRHNNSPPYSHNHGRNVASLKTDAAIAPEKCDFTEYSMTSKRPERANAVRQKATKAEWRTNEHSHDQKPPTPIEPTEEQSDLVTSVTDWLIDSGATAHMTPSKEDFNGTLTLSEVVRNMVKYL
jgi:hypothetical protein